MNPERLEEIIKPLEDLFVELDFIPYGEPIAEKSARVASFRRKDGLIVDYALQVIKDEDKGDASDSEINLSASLYVNESTRSLVKNTHRHGNYPVTDIVNHMIEEEIEPELKLYLLGYID
ncbi:MAG: hypothetical protein KKF46_05300 [Nanoarchaeota archaeon]|nr:hypothetical protein [Nanoarchaeota archaeon]MBU1321750.1 hypothetical protein [Nanoarchaeota archaeon]MBU1597474.1 hypothetical protein [Nanoarchaeota archaeon]MBU2441412.1 hypothetical protein [Nanoarchaeota archaeon]